MELDTKNLFDFEYLINCTLDGKITWKTLTFFLNDLTPTLPKAKELLKIMLREFEAFHKKSKGYQTIKDNSDIDEESEQKAETVDGNDLELDEDENKFETFQEKKKDIENESSEEIEPENNLVHEEQSDEIVENAEMYEIAKGLEKQDFANDTDLENDMTSEENDDKLYQCRTCGNKFISRVGFEFHEKMHSIKDQNKCNHCEKRFVSKATLKVHQSYKCSRLKKKDS